MGTTSPKTCFVVAEFGSTGESKKRSDQTMRHLVRRVLEPRGYEVVRADEIHSPGMITHQIIEHLLDDDLVIADLTGNNPNVFYEIAVRHAAAKPIIHILTDGQAIPFDVKDVRTVYYALDDPDRLDDAKQKLEQTIVDIEASPGEDRNNPVSVVRHLRLLEASGDPEAVEMGEVLSAIKDVRDQLSSMSLQPHPRSEAEHTLAQPIRSLLDGQGGLLSSKEIAEKLGLPMRVTTRALNSMQERREIFFFEDDRGRGWSTIPF